MNRIVNVIVVLITLVFSLSCYAAQVVIVNAANTVELDKSSVSRIFLGKLNKFPDGNSIIAVNQKSGSDVKSSFDKKVLGKSSSQIKAYWSKLMFSGKGKPPKEFASDSEVKSFIAKDKNAIGYIDEANIDENVRVILKL